MVRSARLVSVVCAALLLGVAVGPGRANNLITNGSFENGNYAGGAWTHLDPGSTLLDGWTIGGDGGVDWHDTVQFHPILDGDKVVDLNANGGTFGWISQDIATTPGATYTLSFLLAGPGANFQNPRLLTVEIGGVDYDFSQPASPEGDLVWGEESQAFTATSGVTTLKFLGNTRPEYWGPTIDRVSVAQNGASVPEPGTMALLFGAMVAGTGIVVRRKR